MNARTAIADHNGVLPEEFYSTTNFSTKVCIEGEWISVEGIEMDIAIKIVRPGRAVGIPMHQVVIGDEIVIGYEGIDVDESELGDQGNDGEAFQFMSSAVSTEKPKFRQITQCVQDIHAAKAKGEKVLLVGGPAIIHSGCAEVLATLLEHGHIDILFAGNALAAHDIEASIYRTSLGANLEGGPNIKHGHTHHLRAINRVRRCGSIANAVEQGVITSGAMFTCIKHGIPFVLAGSIRDDGPLPDVITDVIKAQEAMRAKIPGVGVALMVATTLHSVATGNMLPAKVKTYCVDSDVDTVIKLSDRGTQQAVGIVTDAEYFMRELARQLVG